MSKSIAAIATACGGGLGVIRISGEDAFVIADKVFRGKKSPTKMKGFTGTFGHVYDESGKIDEAVVFTYRAPHSYTGENVCEISCHGGRFVLEKVLSAVIKAGAVPASAGEFTKRALLNGKMSLTQAESVIDIINSENRQSLSTALEVKEGALFRVITSVIGELVDIMAHISAWIDYPEEDVEAVLFADVESVVSTQQNILIDLVKNYDKGRMMREGITTAIVGSPNVGKSTLMNLLAGYERSIVTDIAGTTRDVIEEQIRLGDIILAVSDTAGIRETGDIIEQIGIDRSVSRLEQCQLILAVFDSSKALSDADISLLERLKGRYAIAIFNKADLESRVNADTASRYVADTVSISAKTGEGIEQLEHKIAELVGLSSLDSTSLLISNQRQLSCVVDAYKALEQAKESLSFGITLDAVSVNIEEAVDALLSLTGRKASADVIERVFERFCVGK